MKLQILFLLASALSGVIAAPIRERDAKVVTVYQNVVHVVTATSTVWVKAQPKPTPVNEEKGRKDEPAPEPKPKPKPKQKPTSIIAPPKPISTYVAPEPTIAPLPTTSAAEIKTPPKPEPTPEKTTTEYVPPQPTTTQRSEPEPSSTIEASEPITIAATETVATETTVSPTTTTTTPPIKTIAEATPDSSLGGSTGNPGDATFYNTGLGSCGITSSDSENVVAISYILMDAKSTGNSNTNPLCGKKIKCTRGSKSVIVTVVDRCPGCTQYSLDLSPSAFNAMGDPDEGRIPITWEFLD